jgi:outer membrane protein OmpA-like peptidoglycan-associated protein
MRVRRRPSAFWGVRVMALGALATLAACSWVPDSVNPISWYRDLSGASKNDALDKDQRNQQNLEAGGKAPYPNLADVPDAPDRARGTIDRDALQKSLAADRANAHYTNDQLRADAPAPAIAPPPPAASAAPSPRSTKSAATASAAAAQQDAAAPQDSALISPTVRSLPEGEAPAAAPPPPSIAPAPGAAARAPIVASAVEGTGQRRPVPAASVAVASVGFAVGSDAVSEGDRNRLSEIAAMQHAKGGALRVIGHAELPAGADPAQRALAGFTLALDRAKAVAQVLQDDGVPQGSIAVEAAPRHNDDVTAHAEIFLEP